MLLLSNMLNLLSAPTFSLAKNFNEMQKVYAHVKREEQSTLASNMQDSVSVPTF